MDSSLYAKIKESGRYCREIDVRKKLNWFLEAMREGNVRKVCRRYGIIPKTYYFWWKRFKESGFKLASLQPRSRRPRRSPNKTRGKKLKWIRYYRLHFHYGPERIQKYLLMNHGIHVAQSTIGEVIRREKLILRKNRRKKKRRHTRRYRLAYPGQGLQMDIKYVPKKIGGEQYYVYNAIDDFSRYRISRLYRKIGMREAVDFMRYIHRHAPFKVEKLQLDNDRAFTYRLNPNCFDKRHPFSSSAEELGIRLRFIPPGEKELQGKVERLHRTDEDEFFWKANMNSFDSLKRELANWEFEYNHYRHHKSLGWQTPAQALQGYLLEQKLPLDYEINGHRPLRWNYQDKTAQRPKKTLMEHRYLSFLDWNSQQFHPVTDVPGYYRSGDYSRHRRHM